MSKIVPKNVWYLLMPENGEYPGQLVPVLNETSVTVVLDQDLLLLYKSYVQSFSLHGGSPVYKCMRSLSCFTNPEMRVKPVSQYRKFDKGLLYMLYCTNFFYYSHFVR